MNSRAKAILCALIVLACSWVAAAPAVAGAVGDVGVGDVGVGRVSVSETHSTGSAAGNSVSADAGPVTQLPAAGPSQGADHDLLAESRLSADSDAGERIAKPIMIVGAVMFVGLGLLLLTARLIVRRRARRATAER